MAADNITVCNEPGMYVHHFKPTVKAANGCRTGNGNHCYGVYLPSIKGHIWRGKQWALSYETQRQTVGITFSDTTY